MAVAQGWSRLYDDLPDHPKIAVARHLAGWLYVCGQAYSSRHATDGRIPKAIVTRLSDVPQPMRQAQRLVDARLWHDCGDHYQQHDYTEMQTTAADRDQARRAKADKAARGNHVRWHVNTGKPDPDCPWCDPRTTPPSDPRTIPKRSPNDPGGESSGESTEAEAEIDEETSSITSRPSRDPTSNDPAEVSDDAHRLTKLFAQLVVANGHKAPPRGTSANRDWLVEMDRLLRLGAPGGDPMPAPAGEVERVIRWCAADHFEAANVASVPKLRKRYSQLRLKAGAGGNVVAMRRGSAMRPTSDFGDREGLVMPQ